MQDKAQRQRERDSFYFISIMLSQYDFLNVLRTLGILKLKTVYT